MNKQSKPLTQEYLDKKLENFVTKDYLDEKLENFVTKDYLDEKFEKVDKKLSNFRSDVLDAVDEVMGEIKAMREEQELSSVKLSEHSDKLENHESRIEKLEKPRLASI